MSNTVKTGWLTDKNGSKFAPKTLTSQVQTHDGVLLEDKIQADLQKALDGLADVIDSKANAEHTHGVADITDYEADVAAKIKVETDARVEAVNGAVAEYRKTANNTFSNALKGELNGALVSADDVSPIEHDLDVKITAEEIFVFAGDFTGQTQNGEVVARVDNGKIVLNGVAGNTEDAIVLPFSSLSKGTYEYNINYSGGATILFQDSSDGSSIGDSYNLTEGSCTFTLEETTQMWIGVIIRGGLSFSNTILDISLKREDMSDVKLYRYGKNLFKNDINAIKVVTYGTTTKAGYEIKLPVGSYTAHAKGDTSQEGYIYGRVLDKANATVASGINLFIGTDLRTAKFTINEGDTLLLYNGRSNTNIALAQALFSRFNIQIEAGSKETAFEPYIESAEYAVNSDGTVEGVTSVSPYMTLGTDKDSVTIYCEYNRDTNKVIEQLTQAIISLGGNI